MKTWVVLQMAADEVGDRIPLIQGVFTNEKSAKTACLIVRMLIAKKFINKAVQRLGADAPDTLSVAIERIVELQKEVKDENGLLLATVEFDLLMENFESYMFYEDMTPAPELVVLYGGELEN